MFSKRSWTCPWLLLLLLLLLYSSSSSLQYCYSWLWLWPCWKKIERMNCLMVVGMNVLLAHRRRRSHWLIIFGVSLDSGWCVLVDVFSYVSYLVVASGTAIYSEYNNILYIKCITYIIISSAQYSILRLTETGPNCRAGGMHATE